MKVLPEYDTSYKSNISAKSLRPIIIWHGVLQIIGWHHKKFQKIWFPGFIINNNNYKKRTLKKSWHTDKKINMPKYDLHVYNVQLTIHSTALFSDTNLKQNMSACTCIHASTNGLSFFSPKVNFFLRLTICDTSTYHYVLYQWINTHHVIKHDPANYKKSFNICRHLQVHVHVELYSQQAIIIFSDLLWKTNPSILLVGSIKAWN